MDVRVRLRDCWALAAAATRVAFSMRCDSCASVAVERCRDAMLSDRVLDRWVTERGAV